MRPLYASRAFAPAGAAAPAPAPAIPQGTLELFLSVLGHAVSIVITLASIPRLWRLKQVVTTVDHSLLVPLLHSHNHGPAARRAQSWLHASAIHSLTLILYKSKDFSLSGEKGFWRLFFRCCSPLFVLIVSAVLLVILLRRYPISQDLCITRVIIGFAWIGYVLVMLTDMTYLKSTITLEIVLIPMTICMQTLRFASQDACTQFEMITFIVAVLGVISGGLVLIPPTATVGFWEHLMQHLAFNIATLVGAIFRLVDAISIWCSATAIGDAINYFRGRLHECFL